MHRKVELGRDFERFVYEAAEGTGIIHPGQKKFLSYPYNACKIIDNNNLK